MFGRQRLGSGRRRRHGNAYNGGWLGSLDGEAVGLDGGAGACFFGFAVFALDLCRRVLVNVLIWLMAGGWRTRSFLEMGIVVVVCKGLGRVEEKKWSCSCRRLHGAGRLRKKGLSLS